MINKKASLCKILDHLKSKQHSTWTSTTPFLWSAGHLNFLKYNKDYNKAYLPETMKSMTMLDFICRPTTLCTCLSLLMNFKIILETFFLMLDLRDTLIQRLTPPHPNMSILMTPMFLRSTNSFYSMLISLMTFISLKENIFQEELTLLR
jgi:hypothetical protein